MLRVIASTSASGVFGAVAPRENDFDPQEAPPGGEVYPAPDLMDVAKNAKWSRSGHEPLDLFAGRYRIDSVLATGGMGVVYAATHVDLRLPVALKLIHPTLQMSSEARGRFCVEARAGAALKSPHVVRVYDAGQLGSEECFVVMERLEGTNLDDLIRSRGPLPMELAVDYVLQACAGLAEAHAIGLVHRDIKPENLFLAHFRSSAPLIKVMDFGIARWCGDELQNGRLTNSKSNLGSPCYQSPEQMQNAADVDERSDIWSLGLVLYELMTGECPFESDTIQETCWKVLQGPRPSLARVVPDVPVELEAVFQRCLAMDRTQRFSSVKQLSAALRPFARKPVATDVKSALTMKLPRRAVAASAPVASNNGASPTAAPPRSAVLVPAAFVLGVALTLALTGMKPDLGGWGSRVQTTSAAAVVHASSMVRNLLP
jgi:serine/threonine protein kinase